jgi:hypothetical protein
VACSGGLPSEYNEVRGKVALGPYVMFVGRKR